VEEQRKNWIALKNLIAVWVRTRKIDFTTSRVQPPVPLMLGCAYERPLPSHKQRSLFLRWRTKREKAPAEPGPSAEDTQADMVRQLLMNNPLYSAAL